MKGLQILRSALRNVSSVSTFEKDGIGFGQDLTYEFDEDEKEGAKPAKKKNDPETKGH